MGRVHTVLRKDINLVPDTDAKLKGILSSPHAYVLQSHTPIDIHISALN